MSVRGLDVSVWQRELPWDAIRAAGLAFALAKATEGVGFVDPAFARHRAEARRVGIPLGAYHYARPDTGGTAEDPLREADFFLRTARPRPGDLLPALDLEAERCTLPPPELERWAKAWLERVERTLGVRPLLYLNPDVWTARLARSAALAAYPLWLAHYGPDDGQEHPRPTLAPWPAPAIHQYTSRGAIRGWAKPLDLDVLVGTTVQALTLDRRPAAAGAAKPR